jgi:hypothetical protein
MNSESPATSESRSSAWDRATQNLVREGKDDRGSFHVYMPKRDMCVTRARGHFSLDLARLLPDALAPSFAEGRSVALFHDWEGMTTYDSAARRMLTSWVLSNIRSFQSQDFIVASRIVALGIAAASVATSLAGLPLVAHTKRAQFERIVSRAL